MFRSRDYYAFAGLSTKDEPRFDNADYGKTSCASKNARWNAFLGHMPKLSDRNNRAIDYVLLGRVRRDQ
jgi:hypothetical protein